MVRLCVSVNWPCIYLTRIKFYSHGASEVFTLRCLSPRWIFVLCRKWNCLPQTHMASSRFSEVSANLSWLYLLSSFGGAPLAKENLEMPQTNLPLDHTFPQAHQSTPENIKHFPDLISRFHMFMLLPLVSPGVGVSDIWNFFLKLSSLASLGHCACSHKPLQP